MLSTYIVVLFLSISVAALGLLAAYQQHQIRYLRNYVTRLIQTNVNDRKEQDEEPG